MFHLALSHNTSHCSEGSPPWKYCSAATSWPDGVTDSRFKDTHRMRKIKYLEALHLTNHLSRCKRN